VKLPGFFVGIWLFWNLVIWLFGYRDPAEAAICESPMLAGEIS
jgi:hypothetical protein